MRDIRRVQFTAQDSKYHPEIQFDKEYLDFEQVNTGLSEGVCSYGYQEVDGTEYRWIKRVEAIALGWGEKP